MDLMNRFDMLLALAVDTHSKTVTIDNKTALVKAIFQSVEREQSSPPSKGIDVEDMDMARAGLYFFVDEILLSKDTNFLLEQAHKNIVTSSVSSLDSAKEIPISLEWYNSSLQNHFYNTEKGGELFFLYFEQILNRILLFPYDTVNTNTEQQIYALSLNEKFMRASQIYASKTYETGESKQTKYSSFETLKVFAQCLLYGFRGKYYDASYDIFLKELRQTAFMYLHENKDDYDILENLTDNDTDKLADTLIEGSLQNAFAKNTEHKLGQKRAKQRAKLGYFFYIACPLFFCGIWYFYCAQTVSQIFVQ